MINYVTGPLGAGKSYYAVRAIAKGLLEGKAVVTNIELREDWAEVVACHNQYTRFSKSARAHYVHELRSRFLYEADLERLMNVKVRGKGEGRALLVLDEVHRDLNNRDFKEEKNNKFLLWLSMVRKLGFYCDLISQHKDNTDAAARRIATTETQLINLKQIMRVPVIDTQLLPWPVFVAVKKLNDESMPGGIRKKGNKLGRKTFFLGWPRHLYATHQLFTEEMGDENTIWIPARPTVALVDNGPVGGALAASAASGADPERAVTN